MRHAMSWVLRCGAEARRGLHRPDRRPTAAGIVVPADLAVHGVAGRVEHVRRSRRGGGDDLDARVRGRRRRSRPPAWRRRRRSSAAPRARAARARPANPAGTPGRRDARRDRSGYVALRAVGRDRVQAAVAEVADAAEQREHRRAVADVRRLRVLLLRADDDLGSARRRSGRRASVSRSARRPRAPPNRRERHLVRRRGRPHRPSPGRPRARGTRRPACRRRATRTRDGRARRRRSRACRRRRGRPPRACSAKPRLVRLNWSCVDVSSRENAGSMCAPMDVAGRLDGA